ncbi:MAG: HAMP domain-containing histidine kinase [Intrasporangiaceae bacterium]|nr:HAMP domain-containing histidine kinase [Intrasporangiaceae bacterium]
MRTALVRGTMVAVAAVMAILIVPGVLLWVWLFSLAEPELLALVEPLRGARGFAVLAAVTVLQVLVTVAVSSRLAGRQANRLTVPMTQLAERADRLGAGEPRIGRTDSGIDEIDRVSEVLARSSAEIARQLAQQRDFAADASHQLRTPLTALLMRLDEIAATNELDVAREEAGIAIDQVERLTKVVDELLTRSRTQGEEQHRVSLDSVLAALQREWQPAFAHARRSVRVHGERGLYVAAAHSAVSQIVSTLLENSLRHGRGTVDVEARRSGPSVVLEMSDQGEGVPLNLAPYIFERAVSSGGSGLGLALARDLAAANGGRLELLSAQPAVFALFLSEAPDESA